MYRLAASLLLAALALPLGAAPAISDYAFEAELEPADQPLQRIELPLEILLALTREDLGDLAVFDARGKPLPWSVVRAPASEIPATLDLPFHEFSTYLDRHSRTVTTREQNLEPGTVTERETTETLAVRARRNDYLIELAPGDERHDFERLELEWRHRPADQLLELRIEAGNQLDRLRVIQQRKSLTNRESGDAGWRSIDNLPRDAKYLRLEPLDGIESFELLRVTGHYAETRPAPRLEYELLPETAEEDAGNFYHFVMPSAVKPVSMRILPAAEHSVIDGDLYAIWDDLREKRLLRRGFRQHNISGEGVRPSPPLQLPRQRLTEVWFNSRTELSSAPQVELIYPQFELIFLGDGIQPYSLAWGNRDGKTRATGLSGLLDGDLDDAREKSVAVGLGPTQQAGGPARLEPRFALPWLKWLLWAMLIAAALVTGRMAIRLYREMNTGDSA
ncbi:MAG: DUF3999 family protein [Gammaproteobacteria bacterium]